MKEEEKEFNKLINNIEGVEVSGMNLVKNLAARYSETTIELEHFSFKNDLFDHIWNCDCLISLWANNKPDGGKEHVLPAHCPSTANVGAARST